MRSIPLLGDFAHRAYKVLSVPRRVGNLMQRSAQLQQELTEANKEISRLVNKVTLLSERQAVHSHDYVRLKDLIFRMRDHIDDSESDIQTLNKQPLVKKDLERLYTAFEDRFRGSREQIKKRLEVYLPLLDSEINDFRKFPLLDLGCGRGEWLELLGENGFRGTGIDLNQRMLDHAISRGYQVKKADAFSYLSQQPINSIGFVTAFHLVEHLSFENLLRLLELVHRVLIPGGKVIMETPNPEHFGVGSCDFYVDPTHKNPIPPVTLEFLVQHQGFTNVQIKRLNRGSGGLASQNFRDYAVIAEKLI